MQEFVFFIDGDVKHPLTIDPTVWIFDERKVDLETIFDEIDAEEEEDKLLAYTKAISKQWDKEITEGATPPNPNSNQNIIRYEKQKLIHGSFAMPLRPFLENTEPDDNAKTVEIVQKDGNTTVVTYEEGLALLAGFAKDGKKLEEDGPIHIYYGDGSNQENPIKNVIRLTIRK